MRLSAAQADTIRQTVHALLGAGARVSLFGSRVDDAAKGGDIDLFVQVDGQVANRAAVASHLAALLQMQLGDQPIDVILVDRETAEQPIHRIARLEGIRL